MVSKALLTFFAVLCSAQGIFGITIVTKSEWGGRVASSKSYLSNNLAYAVIHHSAGAYCSTLDACKSQMKIMQTYHMDSLGWADIGYNFGIGADGSIYEGRGFGVVGAHATNWNSKSIGIMFIGDYNTYTPTATQITKAKELLAYAVSQGYLASNYILYGHRQVSATECPGNTLYAEIQKWSNWSA